MRMRLIRTGLVDILTGVTLTDNNDPGREMIRIKKNLVYTTYIYK